MVGLAIGFLATGGAWAACVWVSLGNPVFPTFNKVFQSPSAASSNYADLHFLSGGVLGRLACPVWTALGLHPTTGVPVTEPRLLLALVAAALAVLVKLRRAKTPPVRSDRRMARAGAFLAASMTAWLGMFAIQR